MDWNFGDCWSIVKDDGACVEALIAPPGPPPLPADFPFSQHTHGFRVCAAVVSFGPHRGALPCGRMSRAFLTFWIIFFFRQLWILIVAFESVVPENWEFFMHSAPKSVLLCLTDSFVCSLSSRIMTNHVFWCQSPTVCHTRLIVRPKLVSYELVVAWIFIFLKK